MSKKAAVPGVTRANRISDEGLRRLEKQLSSGTNVSALVLKQWIKRYGDEARVVIKKHSRFSAEMDE